MVPKQIVHLKALEHEREGYVRRRLHDRIKQVDEQMVKARDEWWETERPPELLGFFALADGQDEFWTMTLTIKSTLSANLVDSLVNLTVPRTASIFRPCDHNGSEIVLSDVKSQGEVWLWTHEPRLIRAKASTEFYFHIQRSRSLGAIPVRVEVVHPDLPNGLWTYEAVLDLPRPASDSLPVPDLEVVIEREEWDSFQHEAFILELKVRVTNHTDRTKHVTHYALEFGGRETSPTFPTSAAHKEVERRREARPRLDRHSIVESGESVSGWFVYALPWSRDPGPTSHTLKVIDELNHEYVAVRTGKNR